MFINHVNVDLFQEAPAPPRVDTTDPPITTMEQDQGTTGILSEEEIRLTDAPTVTTTKSTYTEDTMAGTSEQDSDPAPTTDDLMSVTTKLPLDSLETTLGTVPLPETTLKPSQFSARDIEIVTESPPELDTTTVIATSISTSEAIVYYSPSQREPDSEESSPNLRYYY